MAGPSLDAEEGICMSSTFAAISPQRLLPQAVWLGCKLGAQSEINGVDRWSNQQVGAVHTAMLIYGEPAHRNLHYLSAALVIVLVVAISAHSARFNAVVRHYAIAMVRF